MKVAEKEHKKNKTKVFTKNKNTKKEAPTPIWFDEKNKIEEASEEEQKELESMLKEFR